jgi:peptidoglycan-associated lipoprotein
MREHLLICTLLILSCCMASSGPCWSKDRQCFAPQTVYFKPGGSTVDAEAKRKVAEVAKYLKANPSTAVLIEGHCDDRGTEEHNRWLGERRAQALRKELIRAGVDPDWVDTVSYGKERPVAPGYDAGARRKNRCGEFVLLTPPKS